MSLKTFGAKDYIKLLNIKFSSLRPTGAPTWSARKGHFVGNEFKNNLLMEKLFCIFHLICFRPLYSSVPECFFPSGTLVLHREGVLLSLRDTSWGMSLKTKGVKDDNKNNKIFKVFVPATNGSTYLVPKAHSVQRSDSVAPTGDRRKYPCGITAPKGVLLSLRDTSWGMSLKTI